MRFGWRPSGFSEDDLDEEIERRTSPSRRNGGSRPENRRRKRSARRGAPSATLREYKEVTRSVWGIGGIDAFVQDLKYAGR